MENRMLVMLNISLIYLGFLIATFRLMLKDIGLRLTAFNALKRPFYWKDKVFMES